MQSWNLDRKIQVTQARILEWYKKWNGKVYVSFSGGKDSTVLLDLVRRVFPDVPAVFIDTGLEYPEIREFVKSVGNVFWLKPEMHFKKVIEKYGYPLIGKEVAQKIYEARKCPNGAVASRFDENSPHSIKYGKRFSMAHYKWLLDSNIPISHMCCKIMKKNPAKKYEKETGMKPYIGTLACESRLRKTEWYKRGCNAFDGKRPTSQPLSFWTEQDILEYIDKYSIKISSIYGDIKKDETGSFYTTGVNRTGCVYCAFGAHLEAEPNRYQKLKMTHPKIWEYCMKPVSEGGLGMKEVLEFIGVKIE